MMAYVLELSNEDKLPRFEFHKGTFSWPGQDLGNGDPVEAETLVENFSATQLDRKKIEYDLFHVSYKCCVSKRFRNLVEKYEPGLHHFHPVILYNKAGERYDDERYIINVGQKIDAIETKRSLKGGWQTKFGSGEPFYETTATGTCLNKSRINGLHLWKGNILGPTSYYVSGGLGGEMKQLRMSGIDLFETTEADVAWDGDLNLGPYLEWSN